MNQLTRGAIAEFIGTCLFVFVGIGSIVAMKNNPGASVIGVAIAHGLALGIAITCCMAVSGGQLNPAVSIGLVVAGKQKPATAGVYIVAQLLGAATAAGLIQLALTPEMANVQNIWLGATKGVMTQSENSLAVVVIEAVCTFFLMMAVLAAVVDPRAAKLGGLPVGLVVTAAILFAGPLTGASMNPARTFGPAVCGRHWDMHWAYWVAPVMGAAAAALVYRTVWEGKAGPAGSRKFALAEEPERVG